MKIIKATDEKRLKMIEELYLRAFPKSERKPFSLMVQKQSEGTMELLSIEEENTFLGLAIFAHDKDIALLDYFAITDEMRGQGVGSRAIKALQKIYTGKRFILEIETTKKTIENSLNSMNDEQSQVLDFSYTQILTGSVRTLDEIIENIKNVTIEDVTKIGSKVELDTIYFMTGNKED